MIPKSRLNTPKTQKPISQKVYKETEAQLDAIVRGNLPKVGYYKREDPVVEPPKKRFQWVRDWFDL